MPRFTKITSSIGPSCETERVLKQMILAGVNVCRLNFSHDTGETQGHKIDLIRKISDALNMPVESSAANSISTLHFISSEQMLRRSCTMGARGKVP